MRTRLLALLICSSAACLPTRDTIELRRPTALAGLGDIVIEASLQAFEEASRCEGEPEFEQALEQRGEDFVGTVHLRPGVYFFCVRFRAEGVELGAYQDLELEVVVDEDKDLLLDDRQFRYQHLDEDGDGIANLDEVRYGYNLGQVDPDHRDSVALPAAGSFLVGAPEDEGSFVEWPEHSVPLYDFAIDRLEVSVERYRLGVVRGLCVPPLGHTRQSFMATEDDALKLPATGVRWEDADRFCREVAGGRLPLEHEWEFAASPEGNAYPWADELTDLDDTRCEYVNARYFLGGDTSLTAEPCHRNASQQPALVAVDHFNENSLGRSRDGCADLPGLPGGHGGPCQLSGNAWEWTASRFLPYPGASWTEAEEELLVIRGGSADSLDYSLRSSFRVGVAADLSSHAGLAPYVGFRCVYDD